jgi:hypothetical protein
MVGPALLQVRPLGSQQQPTKGLFAALHATVFTTGFNHFQDISFEKMLISSVSLQDIHQLKFMLAFSNHFSKGFQMCFQPPLDPSTYAKLDHSSGSR